MIRRTTPASEQMEIQFDTGIIVIWGGNLVCYCAVISTVLAVLRHADVDGAVFRQDRDVGIHKIVSCS